MKHILKRTLSLMLSFALCFSAFPSAAFAGGDDLWTDHAAEVSPNEDGVYEIGSASQLAWLALAVNDWDYDLDQAQYVPATDSYDRTIFRLTADIDLSAHEWVPIGTSRSTAFRGAFDGGGHTVSGMRVGSADEPYTDGYYAGLFGYVQGDIYDLKIAAAAVYAAPPESKWETYAGLVAGTFSDPYSTIGYCEASGAVYTAGTTSSGQYACAGGVVGKIYEGAIESCRTDVTLGLLSEGKSCCLGGIAGAGGSYDECAIQNCVAAAAVSSPGDYHVDGANVSAITPYGSYDTHVLNCVGIIDCGGTHAYSVFCSGTKTNVVSMEKNTDEGDRFRYFDVEGNESETYNTEENMKSEEFLAALNAAAEGIGGGKEWSLGGPLGLPTIARTGVRAYYQVTFVSAGKTLKTVTAPEDSTVSAPAEPSRYGYTFLWWYADDPDVPYDFSRPVTGDLTITARWDAHAYRVVFETGEGSYVYPQAVKQDELIVAPDPAPERKGYTFAGWFTDEACTENWDFGDGVQGNMTLYAKWNRAGGFSLSGRITDKNTGEALSNVSVALSSGQNASSDEFGFYRINNVEAGEYTVSASARGYLDETLAGLTIADGSVGWDAAMAPDEESSGKGVDIYASVSCVYSGMALDGVTVTAVGESEEGAALGPFTQVTDKNGETVFSRLPAGKYAFYINQTGRPGWESYISDMSENVLTGNYSMRCALKPNYQTLTVVVTGYDPYTETDFAPLSGKQVTFIGVNPKRESEELIRRTMTTDEDGRIVWDSVVPITWTISCDDLCYERAEAKIYSDGAGKLSQETVNMPLTFIDSSLSVKLTTPYPDGDIFKGEGGNGTSYSFSDGAQTELKVELSGVSGTVTGGIVREATVDNKGKAEFDLLVPGNYELTVSGSAKRYVSVPAGDGKEIYSSTENTRYGPKYFFVDFSGTGSAGVALGETSSATLSAKPEPVTFSGTLYKSDMNGDGTASTVPVPNTTLLFRPSPYYTANGEDAAGYEVVTDDDGFYSVTLSPGLWGVLIGDEGYDDYFGGYLIYQQGQTDTCYYDYEVRGWPCTGRWTLSRESAWAWLSSGTRQPYGDIAGMNLSSGAVTADLVMLQKVFCYSLGSSNDISGVGIARTTNAEMNLIVNCEKDDGSYAYSTLDYHPESRNATVAMTGSLNAAFNMTGQRFPAVFPTLPPGDYTFTYTLGSEFSHLQLTNWTPQWRERRVYDGIKEVSFYDFPAPGVLPDASDPFPEDYVDINYPDDGAKNPWPMQTVSDDEVVVSFAKGEDGRRCLYDLHDDDASNGELWFKFKNLNHYEQKTLDFKPVEVAEGVYRNFGQEELGEMEAHPEVYADLHLVSQSGTLKTYGYCPPDTDETKNREHWDEEFMNGSSVWNMLFAYTTDKIPGKLFFMEHTYDEWDKSYTAFPDGNVTLYFCAEESSWAHETLVGNGYEQRNQDLFPGMTGDLWFAVDLPANGESKQYSVDFAHQSGDGNGFRFVTKEEIMNMVHPRTIVVQAVDAENNAAPMDVPVSITTADDHVFASGNTYPEQTCSSSVSKVTVTSDEWECQGWLNVTGQYDESTKTETFVVPLSRKRYAYEFTVKDEAGNPVKGAAITVWGDRFDPVTIKTDGSGTGHTAEDYWDPNVGDIPGGLTYQDYKVKVNALGYSTERFDLSAAQLVAGGTKEVTLQRAPQPDIAEDSVKLNKRGAFLPGVHYSGASSQLEFFTDYSTASDSFWLRVTACIDVPEKDSLRRVYLVDRKSFAKENGYNEPVAITVPSTEGDAYNPSAVLQWLEGVRTGAAGKIYVHEFEREYSEEPLFGFILDKTYEGEGSRYILDAEVPLWELPPDGFEPTIVAVTANNAVKTFNIEYDESNADLQLIGVRLTDNVKKTLDWIASFATLKGLTGEAVLRGMEKLMEHVPKCNTPTGVFVPNAGFTASATTDELGYIHYSYGVTGELTTGMTTMSAATGSFMSIAPTTTGLITICGWNISLDGDTCMLKSDYTVELKAGQLDAANYVPKSFQSIASGKKVLEDGVEKAIPIPVKMEFEVMDPPSGMITKTESMILDKDNNGSQKAYKIGVAGRVNTKAMLSGIKAGAILYPGIGGTIARLADKGGVDFGVILRVIAGANFDMDIGTLLYGSDQSSRDIYNFGLGFGGELGLYAKALGEALVATGTIKLSGESQIPKLQDMAAINVKIGLDEFRVTEASIKVIANAHILLRTWFINGEKDFTYEFPCLKYEYNTETFFTLEPMGVNGDLQSRDDFDPATFNGKPETLVDGLLPIGAYGSDEQGGGSFVYTDMDEKGGNVQLLLSEYAGAEAWNEPVQIAKADGLIPACDVVTLEDGRYLAVWTEIDSAHMQETCPPSAVKWSVGTVEDGTWTGAENTLETLDTEVASRLMLAGDGDGIALAALRTAEGAVAENWSLSGWMFDGEAFGESAQLADNEKMNDVAATAAGGKLVAAYVNEDGELTTKVWDGETVETAGYDALAGKIALGAEGEKAWLVCRGEDGLVLLGLGEEGWTELDVVTDAVDAGSPALAVDSGRLVISWTDGSESSDPEETGYRNDADLHVVVLDEKGAVLFAEKELKSAASGFFRGSEVFVTDGDIFVMSILDDAADRLNVYSGGELPAARQVFTMNETSEEGSEELAGKVMVEVLAETGEVHVDGDMSEEKPLLVAAYSDDGQFLGLSVAVGETSVEAEASAVELIIFWINQLAAPIAKEAEIDLP
ncbi:MAG: InlB B-repeat-containing protein [Clostridia bacterium]|nr:InlB B-repeat-containing protein [Clostridia bacterium]